MAPMVFGLEEEVFITEPDKPSLQSLYYLALLVKKNPRFYYTHTHCNFNRGKDLRLGLMSGVEISTGIHSSPEALVADLAQRRRDLAEVTKGFIVPLGSLIDQEAPTNVSGMHIHIGGFSNPQERQQAYDKLIYFLPLLALLTANAPLAGERWFGASYRWAHSFAIGPLRPHDPYYRFQDVIFSQRLGTLELRLFDPVWDLERVRLLLTCIQAILAKAASRPQDIARYNRLRQLVARQGFVKELEPVYQELTALVTAVALDRTLFQQPPGVQVYRLWQEQGTLATYGALDEAYRTGRLPARRHFPPPAMHFQPWKAVAGMFLYYLPRLPYNLWKVWLEW